MNENDEMCIYDEDDKYGIMRCEEDEDVFDLQCVQFSDIVVT
jgi:hypothetical protein